MVQSIDEELRKQVGTIMKQHRQKKNMTLEELSEEAKLDGNNISRFERGEKLPNLKSFLKLVITLEINDSDYLHIIQAVLY